MNKFITGFLYGSSSTMVFVGALAKLQRWPGHQVLTMIGLILFAATVVSLVAMIRRKPQPPLY